MDVGHISIRPSPLTESPILMPMLDPKNSESAHLSYHRDPGLKESKIFDGPMFVDGRPVTDAPLSKHPKNTGGSSLEVEVFVDAKDDGGSSTEEWDMDVVVEGSNQDHAENKESSNKC
ncbi:hypothetical protein A2U01_0024763 [Trifolium medium]|uniref:Uncharacterized protein n=1 Tax=Trifolium medium TaxID=97028 RepID=A0A392NWA8_9FABA|nr:hypothetical protein [Trifolium medium]